MKRADFRKKIDSELKQMGFKPGSWLWTTAPAGLKIAIGGEFRDIPFKANMKKEALAYQLGRMQGWADIMGLHRPLPETKPIARAPRQIDLEEVIAAA